MADERVTYRVQGGAPLEGTVFVQGAKNAVLPMIAAALMADSGRTVLRNVPMIRDVHVAVEIARAVGATVEVHPAERALVIDAGRLTSSVLPAELTNQIRASVLFIPPVLMRLGEVTLDGVGGCDLGGRGLDFHYRGFARLGATVLEEGDRIRVVGGRHRGTHLYLDMPSHTGTENLIAAACCAEGTSVIENAALEPEIADFALFLNRMGAQVHGVGTGFITVEGVDRLCAVQHTVLPDRIDAGVLAMAVAASGGSATLAGVQLADLGIARWKLEQMGVDLEADGAVVRVSRTGPLRPINVLTWPYPGFATDLQPPMISLACLADGVSWIREIIFEQRFAVVGELARMGAEITVKDGAAVVHGPRRLHGAEVHAHDLRAGVALVLAALIADGESLVGNGAMVERGHGELAPRLASLGATITREVEPR
ncbi:MAG: UDP-N-acetylglucosamine 1-carboxyvinyltransferase [Acidimicrobiales bacterium]|nr:UDP-N-acetylglucosamine 1-carboxyvinyltransferase [Acidimicrobiales bacterium]